MGLDSRIVVAWPSTAASIPAGWERDTRFDGKYIQGAPGAGNADFTARGAATHIHTSPAHQPTSNPHTHTVEAPFQDASDVALGTASGPSTMAATSHVHGASTSDSATPGNSSRSIIVDAASNDLAYFDVIFIKPTGASVLPADCYAFALASETPTDWTRVQAGKYLRGAATGGDGGGSGGANTHDHTSPAHTHTQNSHFHSPVSDTGSSGTAAANSSGGTAITLHVHLLGLDSTTATNQPVTTTIGSNNHEPAYQEINIVRNDGPAILPTNVVALWTGNHADILADWIRVTAMDGKFAKGAASDTFASGGSTTHTHTASDCQPIQNPHTHTVTDGGVDSTGVDGNVGSPVNEYATDLHIHAWTCSEETATNNAVAVTINANASESAYPPYVRPIFIKYTGATVYDFIPSRRHSPAVEPTTDLVRQPQARFAHLAAPPPRGSSREIELRSWIPVADPRPVPRRSVFGTLPPPTKPWLTFIADWWRATAPQIARRLALLFPGPTPIAPPEPTAAPCATPVVVAPAAFSRVSAPAAGFSRSGVAGAYSRGASPTLGFPAGYGDDYGGDYGAGGPATSFGREAAPGGALSRSSIAAVAYAKGVIEGAFARLTSPALGHPSGYGDDFGSDYGAGGPPDDFAKAAAPPGSSSRAVPPAGGFDREPALAPGTSRMEPPDCHAGLGYGDDYGVNFGGG